MQRVLGPCWRWDSPKNCPGQRGDAARCSTRGTVGLSVPAGSRGPAPSTPGQQGAGRSAAHWKGTASRGMDALSLCALSLSSLNGREVFWGFFWSSKNSMQRGSGDKTNYFPRSRGNPRVRSGAGSSSAGAGQTHKGSRTAPRASLLFRTSQRRVPTSSPHTSLCLMVSTNGVEREN